MNHQKRQWEPKRRLNGSLIATACFLLFAAAVVCCCVLLVGRMAKRELGIEGEKRQADAAPVASPASSARPTPEARMAAAVYTPPASHDPSTPLPAATIPPATPPPTPQPTLLPVQTASAMHREGADFLLIGLDASERVDVIAAIRVRSGACRVLSVPRNTLTTFGAPLSSADSAAQASRILTGVFPIRFTHTIEIRLPGLAQCIDRFGGITIDGNAFTGSEAMAYLANGPTDELLRIERQQTLMHACLDTLLQTGWFSLLSARLALEPYIGSSLSLPQSLELYTLFKSLDSDDVSFSILPVDSVSVESQRYYTPDAALVNELASAFLQ